MFDLRQLQIFIAVWEHRSVSRAAEAVHLTQPTVSAHLKALEDAAGMRLFDRTPKQVVPTAAGHLLYPFAQQILKLNRQAGEALSEFLGQENGILELGASNIPGQYLLPALVGEFRENRPGIRITINIADTAQTVENVQSSVVELGLVGATVNRKELVFKECFSDELMLVTQHSDTLAKGKTISLDEMLSLPFIVRERGSGTRLTFEKALLEKDIRMEDLDIVMELGSTEAVRQAVKAGIGCAMISRRAVADDLECGLLKGIDVSGLKIRRKFYTVRRKGITLSPLTQSFHSFLMEKSKTSS